MLGSTAEAVEEEEALPTSEEVSDFACSSDAVLSLLLELLFELLPPAALEEARCLPTGCTCTEVTSD